MTVPEITMGVTEARAAFREYRSALKRKANAEDKALARAYHALSQRRRVIDLTLAMQQAGLDERQRPKLAIIRADAEIVFCRTEGNGSACFSTQQWPRGNAADLTAIRLPAGTFRPSEPVACRARVPMIPPRFRPEGDLTGYAILWEAEWINVPVDPFLLRPLGKNLYVVLAQWDLTPVEQAILRARPR